MEIIARNYTVRGGEIDLIAREGAYIVFVEVKLRNGAAGATGATGATGALGREAVTREKQRRICRTAMRYVVDNGLTNCFTRFDVIEIQQGRVTHIRNAFLYQE